MVGTKSRGYSNSGRLSEGEYSVPFFSTLPSPTLNKILPISYLKPTEVKSSPKHA